MTVQDIYNRADPEYWVRKLVKHRVEEHGTADIRPFFDCEECGIIEHCIARQQRLCNVPVALSLTSENWYSGYRHEEAVASAFRNAVQGNDTIRGLWT